MGMDFKYEYDELENPLYVYVSFVENRAHIVAFGIGPEDRFGRIAPCQHGRNVLVIFDICV